MKRFLIFWVVLGAAQFVGRASISFFFFRALDLRFVVLFENVLVPALQAALLCRVLPEAEGPSRWAAWKAALQDPLVAFFLGLDALVLLAAWVLRGNAWFLLTARAGIPTLLAGLQVLASGGLLVFLAAGRRFSAPERAWLLAAAAGLIAYGLDYFVPWIVALPDLLLARRGQLWRWVLVYPPLFLLSVAFLFKMEAIIRRQWAVPAAVLDAVPAFALAGGTIIALNIFWGPVLTEPWLSLVKTCSFLAAASLFASLLFLFVSSRSATPGSLSAPPS